MRRMELDIEIKNTFWEQKISNNLQTLLRNKTFCDLKFRTSDNQFVYSHLCVVTAFIPFLKVELLREVNNPSSVKEVYLSNVSEEIMQKIVAFCYGNVLSVSAEQVGPLLVATDLLQMTDLHDLLAEEQKKVMLKGSTLVKEEPSKMNDEVSDSDTVSVEDKNLEVSFVINDGDELNDRVEEGDKEDFDDQVEESEEASVEHTAPTRKGTRKRKRKVFSYTTKKVSLKKQKTAKVESCKKKVSTRTVSQGKKENKSALMKVKNEEYSGEIIDDTLLAENHQKMMTDQGNIKDEVNEEKTDTYSKKEDISLNMEIKEEELSKQILEVKCNKVDAFSQYEAIQLVSVHQQTNVSLVTISNISNAARVKEKCEGEEILDAEVAEIFSENIDVSEAVEGVVIPQRMHRVTQTDWLGTQYFHKASQFPDQDYIAKEDDHTLTRKSPVEVVPKNKSVSNAIYFNPSPQFVQHGLPYVGPSVACLPTIPQVMQPVGMRLAPTALPRRAPPFASVSTGLVAESSNSVTAATATMTASVSEQGDHATDSARPDNFGVNMSGTPKHPHLSIKDAVGIIKASLVSGNSSNPVSYPSDSVCSKEKQMPSYASNTKPTFTPRSVKTTPERASAGESLKEEAKPGFIGPKAPDIGPNKPSVDGKTSKEALDGRSVNPPGVQGQVEGHYSAAASGVAYPTAGVMLNPQQRYMYPGGFVQPLYPGSQVYYPGLGSPYGYMYPRW